MAINYQQTANAATSGIGVYCSGAVLIGGSQEKTTLCTIGGSGAGSPVTVGGSQFDSGNGQAGVMMEIEPAASVTWAAGTWTIRLNVTTGNANVTWASTYICRLNSGGISQATIGSNVGHNTSMTATGVKTITVTGSSQTPGSGDSAMVVLVFNCGAANQSFACQFNQVIDTPFTETTGLTADKGSLSFSPNAALVFKQTLLADKNTVFGFAGKEALFSEQKILTADKGLMELVGAEALFETIVSQGIPRLTMAPYRAA